MYRTATDPTARRRASRLALSRTPPPAADPDAALDAELLGMLATAGGDATLRELFERDATWTDPAPLWATAAALRLVRAGLVRCHGRSAVLTLTPAGVLALEAA